MAITNYDGSVTYEDSDFLVENTKTLPDQIKKFCHHFAELYNKFTLDKIYPTGSVYITLNPADPADTIGGTWERLDSGRFLISADENGEYYAGGIGGSATQTLTSSNLPSHRHAIGSNANVKTEGISGTSSSAYIVGTYTYEASITPTGSYTDYTGSGRAFEIMPPYLAMYMWIRTG